MRQKKEIDSYIGISIKYWTRESIEHNKRLFTLWKDSDPGIAEVKDVKKRLVGLKSPRL